MYQNSVLKDKRFPTDKEVIKAMSTADKADDTQRDVRPLMSILMRLAEASPRLRGHIGTLRAGITSFDWSIKAFDASDKDRANQAKTRCSTIIDYLLEWSVDVDLYGAMAVELDWVTGGPNGTTPKVLTRYAPVEIEQNGHDPNKIVILDDADKAARRPIANDSEQTWIAHCDSSFERGGNLRSLAIIEVLLNEQIKEWANLNRKFKGIMQAIVKEYATDEERKAALEALKNAVLNNFLMTSEATEFRANKIADAAGGTSFKEFMEKLESASAITLLGQANTAELPKGGGSRAALEVLDLIRADRVVTLKRRAERIVQRLLLSDFQMNSEATATEAPWQFSLSVAQQQNYEANARTAESLIDKGIPILRDELYERTGWTVPPEGAEVVQMSPRAGIPTI